MGEYADMIIEGEKCQECGDYLGGACGYSRSCWACNKASGTGNDRVVIKGMVTQSIKPVKEECHICKRKVKAVGIKDHMRDVHGKANK